VYVYLYSTVETIADRLLSASKIAGWREKPPHFGANEYTTPFLDTLFTTPFGSPSFFPESF
jgi:hypothetical protein